jgi:hypothetical protein
MANSTGDVWGHPEIHQFIPKLATLSGLIGTEIKQKVLKTAAVQLSLPS